MLNILSIEEKKRILNLYRFRLTVVGTFAICALVLASLVLLAPQYLLSIAKHSNSEKQLSDFEERYGSGIQEKEVTAQIREANNKILLLLGSDVSNRLVPSSIISKIIETKEDNVKIYGFTYDASTSAERIVVTGMALDRDALANFIEALKKDETYSNVTLPISSYVKSKNIEFSIVLERKPAAPKK